MFITFYFFILNYYQYLNEIYDNLKQKVVYLQANVNTDEKL
jgi:hypothetical protein